MTQTYLPNIGATGNYVLKAPYDNLLKPQVTYTCQAIRRLSDILANGEDAFSLYYDAFGLSDANYEEDLINDVLIVSLQAGDGHWVYVPSTYVTMFPNMNGIVYRAVMLGVSLGAIPDLLKLDPLKTAITNLVYDTLGVSSVVRDVVISSPAIIPTADHELIETARVNKIKIKMSESAQLSKARAELAIARNQINTLEEYIKTKLPT